MAKINVLNKDVTITSYKDTDYICITDIAKYKNADSTDDLIRNWLRNRNTIEFLGIWEHLNNTDFKPVEFDGFKKLAGLNSFILTSKIWESLVQWGCMIRLLLRRLFSSITRRLPLTGVIMKRLRDSGGKCANVRGGGINVPFWVDELRKNMNLLPHDKFNVFVHLPPWEVCRRLLENVSEKTFWSDLFPGDMKFKGDIQESSFKIYRNIGYRNSGLPVLCGELEEIEGGTKIKVEMRLHRFVQLFLGFWVVMQLSFLVRGMESFIPSLIMIFAAGAIVYLGFLFEARKSKEVFIALFEKEIGTANQRLAPALKPGR
jgi:hypothetical protein